MASWIQHAADVLAIASEGAVAYLQRRDVERVLRGVDDAEVRARVRRLGRFARAVHPAGSHAGALCTAVRIADGSAMPELWGSVVVRLAPDLGPPPVVLRWRLWRAGRTAVRALSCAALLGDGGARDVLCRRALGAIGALLAPEDTTAAAAHALSA